MINPARSLAEQHADHVRVAGEQGWSLIEDSYRDESSSSFARWRRSPGGHPFPVARRVQEGDLGEGEQRR